MVISFLLVEKVFPLLPLCGRFRSIASHGLIDDRAIDFVFIGISRLDCWQLSLVPVCLKKYDVLIDENIELITWPDAESGLDSEVPTDGLLRNATKALREIPPCRIGCRVLRGERRAFRQRRIDPGANQRDQRRRAECSPIVVVHLFTLSWKPP